MDIVDVGSIVLHGLLFRVMAASSGERPPPYSRSSNGGEQAPVLISVSDKSPRPDRSSDPTGLWRKSENAEPGVSSANPMTAALAREITRGTPEAAYLGNLRLSRRFQHERAMPHALLLSPDDQAVSAITGAGRNVSDVRALTAYPLPKTHSWYFWTVWVDCGTSLAVEAV